MKNPDFNRYVSLSLRSFLQGLLIIGPIGTTIAVIWYIVSSIDNIIPSVSEKFPGLVFFAIIILTAIIGFLGTRFVFGKVIVDAMDNLLEHTPGIKYIYSSVKDVMSSFVGDKKKFNIPVWVLVSENPEVWRVGFLTQSEMSAVSKENYVAVYMPHSYAVSGWVIVTPSKNVKPIIGMSAAEAMKFAVSGGVSGFNSDEVQEIES